MNEQDLERGVSTTMGSMTGFILGAAVGAGLALLLAPAAGHDTRRRVGKTAQRLGSQLKSSVGDIKQNFGNIKDDVRSAVSEGRDAFNRERDMRTQSPNTMGDNV